MPSGRDREVLAGQRLHARVEPVGRDFDAALVLFDPDVGVRQRLDDFVELLRRQRERAALRDRRRARAPQPNLEIRGQKLDVVAVSIDQHVCKDGNRVLAFDDALEQLQFAQQIGLAYDELHCGDDLVGSRRRRPTDPFKDERDLGTKNYNSKEVMLKTTIPAITPSVRAI